MPARVTRVVQLLLLCLCPAIVLKIKQYLGRYKHLVQEETKMPVRISFSKRLWAWRHGFLSRAVVEFSLNRDNVHRYLPDACYYPAHPYNGMFSNLIDNKLNLYFTLGAFREYLPVYYLLVYKGEIVWLDRPDHAVPQEQTDTIVSLCREKGKLAMKPLAGTYGMGFHVMAFEDDGYRLDGEPVDEEQLRVLCSGLSNYLITEFVKQHPYADALFPQATNTIRILSVRDYDAHECFIARAVHRIGCLSTVPVDNWSQGGLVCNVDMDSGKLSVAILSPRANSLVRCDRHPDTGSLVTGTVVPHWDTVKSMVLKMANALAMVPYMGWDIVVTEESFKVLEINSLPGTDTLQVHGPLLDDERLRRFYASRIPSLRTRQ
jgi:hypothetical protein